MERPSYRAVFGPAGSTWTQMTLILPSLIKAKLGLGC